MKSKAFTKFLTAMLLIALSLTLCFGSCNKNKNTSDSGSATSQSSTSGRPGRPSGNRIDIDFYTTVNIVEQEALQMVADAYMDMMYSKGTEYRINILNDTDPNSYMEKMRNNILAGVSNPTIAMTSVLSEYYGTDKLVDLSPYLEEPNPYIAGNEQWKDAIHPDGYRSQRSGNTYTVPNISYSTNYVTAFYDKAAMRDVMAGDPSIEADGTVKPECVTWEWMLNALKKAKEKWMANAPQGTTVNPLGVSTSKDSCGFEGFNVISTMINMYFDQYFRDFTQTVHSVEGDYNYVAAIDGKWQYDQSDPSLDATANYNSNFNKVIYNFYTNDTYTPESDRYAELMGNLYDLFQYSSKTDSYNDCFNKFNNTTITFEGDGSYPRQDWKLFYVETLGYVRTYWDAFKRLNFNKIKSRLGWFLLPAMESDIQGVADNVRPTGGPCENFGIISTGSETKDRQAVDFMMYLYSPEGQRMMHASYLSNECPIAMNQLIYGVEVPSDIDFTTVISASGDCSYNPYVEFGAGAGMATYVPTSSGTKIGTLVGETYSSYLRGDQKDWKASGKAAQLFNILKEGFPDYAQHKNLLYTNYLEALSSTSGGKNSPFITA